MAVLNDVPQTATYTPGNVVMIASPGAATSNTLSPKFENELRVSASVVEPTPSACDVGGREHGSVLPVVAGQRNAEITPRASA